MASGRHDVSEWARRVDTHSRREKRQCRRSQWERDLRVAEPPGRWNRSHWRAPLCSLDSTQALRALSEKWRTGTGLRRQKFGDYRVYTFGMKWGGAQMFSNYEIRNVREDRMPVFKISSSRYAPAPSRPSATGPKWPFLLSSSLFEEGRRRYLVQHMCLGPQMPAASPREQPTLAARYHRRSYPNPSQRKATGIRGHLELCNMRTRV